MYAHVYNSSAFAHKSACMNACMNAETDTLRGVLKVQRGDDTQDDSRICSEAAVFCCSALCMKGTHR